MNEHYLVFPSQVRDDISRVIRIRVTKTRALLQYTIRWVIRDYYIFFFQLTQYLLE